MTIYNHIYENAVLDYFKDKADQYDMVEEQVYWQLSDKLLWDVFQEKVLKTLPSNFRFLDAGGGTGRWTATILKLYPKAHGVLYDICKDMSQKATEKAEKNNFSDRLTVYNGRLEEISTILPNTSFDLIFNFHNVLGFVQDVDSVIKQLSNLLKPKGMLLSFVPNKYHNIFFNIFIGNIEEAEQPVKTGKGRFTINMPYMNVFTPTIMRDLYKKNNLDLIIITGFPSIIYPGMQETQIKGSTDYIEDILSDMNKFERIYQLERSILEEPEIAVRGNNLFVLGKKLY